PGSCSSPGRAAPSILGIVVAAPSAPRAGANRQPLPGSGVAFCRGRKPPEEGAAGGGDGDLQPGQREAPRAGGHRTGDRRHSPERRYRDPGAVQGEDERAAAGPAGGGLHGVGGARGS
ncbi:unnamed protein product, partial [Gulo gulo]